MIDHDINTTRLQSRETLRPAQRHKIGFVWAAENGGGNRAADIGIETVPAAFVVQFKETRRTTGNSAALQSAALLDGFQSGALACRGRALGHGL